MSTWKALAVAAAAMTCGALLEPARADEAYVCEGGKLIYVAFRDLERMKRENACVAAYYGLAAEPGAALPAAPAEPQAGKGEPRAPVAQASSTGRVTPGIAIRRRPAPASETTARQVAPSVLPTRALPPPSPSDPPADYRNVRILNAEPGAATIHRHVH
jgi:hypothetical protein